MAKRSMIRRTIVCTAFSALFSTVSLAFLPGCAVVDWFMGRTSDAEVDELNKDLGTPDAHKTPYEDALNQFGRMLTAYEIPQTYIQCKPIMNKTAEKELPEDLSKMMATSISRIGSPINYLPYDPFYIIQEGQTGGAITKTNANAVVDGGITEYDKDLIEKERELRSKMKISQGDYGSKYNYDGGAGYKAGSSTSSMTLDLMMQDYKTTAALQGTQTSNSIFVRKLEIGWGIGFYFQGCGASFDYTYRAKQGRHYALRLLVELSTIETIGKYLSVPYWRCIPGAKPDDGMLQRTREFFADLSAEDRNSFLKSYLYLNGAPCVQTDGRGINRSTKALSSEEEALVADAMAKNNCSTPVDLLIKLWENLPVEVGREQSRKFARLNKEKVDKFNKLFNAAATEFENGRYLEARRLCVEMVALMPENPDPKTNIQKIDAILRDEEIRRAAATAPPPASTENVVAPAASQPNVNPTPKPDVQSDTVKEKPAPQKSLKQAPSGFGINSKEGW